MLGQHTAAAVRPIAARAGAGGLGERLVRAPVIAARMRITGSIQQSVITRLMLAMMLVVLAMVLYLQQASQVSIHEFNITDLRQQQAQYALTNVNLNAQAYELHSLTHIRDLAVGQLHMGRPDLSSAIWSSPLVPVVGTPLAVTSDTATAKQQSRPLHWMTTSLTWIKSQL